MSILEITAGVIFGVTALPFSAAVRIHQVIRLNLVDFSDFDCCYF